jgi:hypothetical protein
MPGDKPNKEHVLQGDGKIEHHPNGATKPASGHQAIPFYAYNAGQKPHQHPKRSRRQIFISPDADQQANHLSDQIRWNIQSDNFRYY